MQEHIFLTGMILKQLPIGEYDKHITLLTRERGKITAFAKGARRPVSKLAAATNPFVFGKFKIYQGKTSYTVSDVEVVNYFEDLRMDYIGVCYGMYFAEVCDYYTRENNDESEVLKLLYQSLRALVSDSIPNPLVRAVFECKVIAVNGEFPGIPSDMELNPSTRYALEYIVGSSIEKLFTFAVTEEVLLQLQEVAARYMKRIVGRDFKSLEVLKSLQ
ncbi:MAG: DNA repair protein RecO [Lachnospiraceae bacterium]|nr:DNA repair protein RecO [Lachnospiraceae bacterium]